MKIEIPEKYARTGRRCSAVNCKVQTCHRFRWCRKHTAEIAMFDAKFAKLLKDLRAQARPKKKCETWGCQRQVTRGVCTRCHQRNYRQRRAEKCKAANLNYRAAKKAIRDKLKSDMRWKLERALKDRVLAQEIYDHVYNLGYRAGLAAPRSRRRVTFSAPAQSC